MLQIISHHRRPSTRKSNLTTTTTIIITRRKIRITHHNRRKLDKFMPSSRKTNLRNNQFKKKKAKINQPKKLLISWFRILSPRSLIKMIQINKKRRILSHEVKRYQIKNPIFSHHRDIRTQLQYQLHNHKMLNSWDLKQSQNHLRQRRRTHLHSVFLTADNLSQKGIEKKIQSNKTRINKWLKRVSLRVSVPNRGHFNLKQWTKYNLLNSSQHNWMIINNCKGQHCISHGHSILLRQSVWINRRKNLDQPLRVSNNSSVVSM